MNRGLSLVLVSAAFTLASLVTACSDQDIGSFGSSFLSISADLDKDPNPDVKAAGAASTAIDREDEARKLGREAIDDAGKLDFAKMDKAIELDPTNADRRVQKAVMQMAAGQDWSQTMGEARFLAQKFGGISSKKMDGAVVSATVSYLTRAQEKFDKTSVEYGRLQKQLCAQIKLYNNDYADAEDYHYTEAARGC